MTITGRADFKALDELGETLGEYARVSGRMPGRIVKDKARQFVLGSDSEYGEPFKGMYDSLKARSPLRGEITATVTSILKGGGGIRINKSARTKAAAMLPEGSAGLFRVTRRGIAPVYINSRGRHVAGTKRNIAAGASALIAQNNLRSFQKAGEVVLNRQSLAAAYEIRKREAARGYWAYAYVAGLFKKFFRSMRGDEFSARISGENSAGNTISWSAARATAGEAWFEIVAFTAGSSKAGYRLIAARVLRDVRRDMQTYIKRKQNERQGIR